MHSFWRDDRPELGPDGADEARRSGLRPSFLPRTLRAGDDQFGRLLRRLRLDLEAHPRPRHAPSLEIAGFEQGANEFDDLRRAVGTAPPAEAV